ncbi:MAG TPA: helix-turn-helix domain-containing protein [Usitatibacter sp.]|nr:helix-turn-helix domain-containing protein [Usitatibacter sp.]
MAEAVAMRRIAIVVFPDAQVLDVAGPMEVVRGANLAVRKSARGAKPAYATEIVARREGAVQTSCGLSIVATNSFRNAHRDIDTLIVAGGLVEGAIADDELVAFVRARAARARRVVAIGTGVFVLAVAGLLEGRRATTHWRACKDLARDYPGIEVDPEHLFIRDGKYHTSAGATAAIDQTLALVQEDLGREVAMAVAHRKVMFMRRSGEERQVSAHLSAQMVGHERIAKLVSWILDNLARDITTDMIAAQGAMSERSMYRLFVREVGMPPARFIEQARVDLARRLLEESDMRVETIARRCGLGNEERLRRAFHRSFGMSPRNYQARHQQAAGA